VLELGHKGISSGKMLWLLRPELGFEFEIRYQPGIGNVADPFSRAPMLLAILTRVMARRLPPPRPIVLLPPQPEPVAPPPLLNIKQLLQQSYENDPLLKDDAFRSILNSVDGLYIMRMGHLYVPATPALRDAIFYDTHDADYAGHVRVDKTYERLQRLYWWPAMKTDVHIATVAVASQPGTAVSVTCAVSV
jgi:hypothetical protein